MNIPELIEAHKGFAEKAINRFWNKFDFFQKLKSNPDTPKNRITATEYELTDWEDYIASSEGIIQGLKDYIETLKNKMFAAGYDKASKEAKKNNANGSVPDKLFDKEKFRAYWNAEKMELWKDHF